MRAAFSVAVARFEAGRASFALCALPPNLMRSRGREPGAW